MEAALAQVAQAAQRAPGGADLEAVEELSALGVLVLLAVDHQPLLGLHRPAPANPLVRVAGVGDVVVLAEVLEQQRALLVDHDAQRTLLALLEEQDDRKPEVRVLQVGDRDQEAGCQLCHAHIMHRKRPARSKRPPAPRRGERGPAPAGPFAAGRTGTYIYPDCADEARGASALNILVVEDETHVAELIRSILEEMGNVCILARSADEADRVLDGQSVDGVTLDLGMPGRGGLDWLGAVAVRDPDLARRTLVITGMHLESEAIRRLALYGAGVLAKPFTVDGLLEAVSSQIGRAA